MHHDQPNTQTLDAIEQIAMQATAIDEPHVPSRILVVPWGEVKSTAGAFVVDDEAASVTLAAFTDHGTDLPVDYEHQTLGGAYSSPNGLAPAAGWIKALRVVTPAEAGPDGRPGIWADVEWTPDALEKLRGKQYRYLSPVALVRRDDRRVVGIHSIALTNKPAIVGMKPLVNSNAPPAPDSENAVGDLRELLSLDESATEDLILVAAVHRIRSLQSEESLRQATVRIERAAAAGKLAPAQREWAIALALRDPAEFDRWEAAAPAVVTLGRITAPSATHSDPSLGRRAVEQSARVEYRANRALLEKICTEEAYVSAAVREPV